MIFYISYYTIVVALWLMVGIVYFFFVWPCVKLYSLIKGKPPTVNITPAATSPTYANPQPVMPQIRISGVSSTSSAKLDVAPFAKKIEAYGSGFSELKYVYDDVALAMNQNHEIAKAGANVTLKPEPDNPHDKNAVAAFLGSKTRGFTQIGYLYKGKLQDMYHDFIGRGGYVSACVQAVEGDKIKLFVGYYEQTGEANNEN